MAAERLVRGQTDGEADRHVVLQEGKALQLAVAELTADRDVGLEAVRQDGKALVYAGADLQADLDVVLEALRQR